MARPVLLRNRRPADEDEREMIHHFQPTRYHNTLGPHEPVLHIVDGDP